MLAPPHLQPEPQHAARGGPPERRRVGGPPVAARPRAVTPGRRGIGAARGGGGGRGAPGSRGGGGVPGDGEAEERRCWPRGGGRAEAVPSEQKEEEEDRRGELWVAPDLWVVRRAVLKIGQVFG